MSRLCELGSRRVHFTGRTVNPSSLWATPQARQLDWTLPERADPVNFFIWDHDSKFTSSFDAVLQGEGIRIVETPIRAPPANQSLRALFEPLVQSAWTGS